MSPRRERGFGLPVAIFVVLVLGMVAIAIAELGVNSQQSVIFDVQATRAFMAAQSGAEVGVNRLFPPAGGSSDCSNSYFSASPSLSFSVSGLDDCSVIVTCTEDTAAGSDYFLLTSAGACGTGPSLAERIVGVRIAP